MLKIRLIGTKKYYRAYVEVRKSRWISLYQDGEMISMGQKLSRRKGIAKMKFNGNLIEIQV